MCGYYTRLGVFAGCTVGLLLAWGGVLGQCGQHLGRPIAQAAQAYAACYGAPVAASQANPFARQPVLGALLADSILAPVCFADSSFLRQPNYTASVHLVVGVGGVLVGDVYAICYRPLLQWREHAAYGPPDTAAVTRMLREITAFTPLLLDLFGADRRARPTVHRNSALGINLVRLHPLEPQAFELRLLEAGPWLVLERTLPGGPSVLERYFGGLHLPRSPE